MPAPTNMLKKRLQEGQALFGIWLGLADPSAAEIAATAGFDWLLIDGEYAPNDIRSLSAQLAVIEGKGPSVIRALCGRRAHSAALRAGSPSAATCRPRGPAAGPVPPDRASYRSAPDRRMRPSRDWYQRLTPWAAASASGGKRWRELMNRICLRILNGLSGREKLDP